MRKIKPLLRVINIIIFIKNENDKGNYPNLIKITRSLSDFFNAKYNTDSDLKSEYPKSTFDKDKKRIADEFGLTIEYKKDGKNGYEIEFENQEEKIKKSLEYFQLFSLLNQSSAVSDLFILSKRKPNGLGNMLNIVTGIKNKNKISFEYKNFENGENDKRNVRPLALKESRERWYLIATKSSVENPTKSDLRAFALDRMTEIHITSENFRNTISLEEINSKYEELFAMFDSEEEVEDIVLKFDRRDGNYIESFPLHHSQKIEKAGNSFLVRLKLKITPDFIMEIMSRAWSLEVIKPLSLKKQVYDYLKKAADRNKI